MGNIYPLTEEACDLHRHLETEEEYEWLRSRVIYSGPPEPHPSGL